MKTKKLIRIWTNIRRRTYVTFGRIFSSNERQGRIRPKKLSHAEETACDIFIELLLNKESKLHYDIKTSECYISSSDKTLFVFLEAGNVKIINSVFGYDVHIGSALERYLLERFTREMAIRRMRFKGEVLSKINQSLDLTLKKVKNEKLRKATA
jgi:hypothetical protein